MAIGGELYLATRDGDLFKKIGADDPSDLPLVTGILPAQVTSDRAGVVITIKRVLDVAEELDRVGLGKRYPIEELHLDKDGSLVVSRPGGHRARLGQPPYRDKIEEAARDPRRGRAPQGERVGDLPRQRGAPRARRGEDAMTAAPRNLAGSEGLCQGRLASTREPLPHLMERA